MMPEVDTMPIVIGGKKVASLMMIYGPSGWKAQIVQNTKPSTSEVLAEGKDLLGPEAARQMALSIAGKWRDQEASRRRP
jgi:hypothetical protein